MKNTPLDRYRFLLIVIVLVSPAFLSSQTVLSADGSSNTYGLINGVLAPGHNAVETPDCGHEDFGDHIDQVMDDDLGRYVFRFHIHVDEDNDRCKNYDRQRNEIKTYDQSPDELKAVDGEVVEYKWLFKLDKGFQTSSSFTHLHQIKAVGGSEAGMPLITLTARSADLLQIRYAKHLTQTTIEEVDLSPCLGQWVEATEQISFGESGSYKISINRVSDGVSVLDYENNDIRMWKTDAEFLRPKWGIYRSLNNYSDLRDEILLYADFSIEELNVSSLAQQARIHHIDISPNPSQGHFKIHAKEGASLELLDGNGRTLITKTNVDLNQRLNFNLTDDIYFIKLIYPTSTLIRKLIIVH